MDTHPFRYPCCPIESHSQQPLSRICLDNQCNNKVPLCCICEFQQHKDHNTIPIIHILKQLKSSSEDTSPAEGAANLSSLRKHFFDAVANCRREVLHELNQLQAKGGILFNACQQNLFGFYQLSRPLSTQAQSDPKLYKKYFARLLALIPTENKSDFTIKDKIEQLVNTTREREKKLSESLGLLLDTFRKSIKSIESFLGQEKFYQLRWSEVLKGAKVKITGMLAQQSGMQSSGQRFCLMDEPLPETKCVQWGIKVKKFVGWVGIGICLKNLIKTANYHFNYSNIGHGSYLISTNGYTWSHSVKEFNSSSKCFNFTTNDTVYIEYDPINQKIRFRKNQSTNVKDKYELSVVPPPAGDIYHPCVNLCSTGDSVEIIYPGIPLS